MANLCLFVCSLTKSTIWDAVDPALNARGIQYLACGYVIKIQIIVTQLVPGWREGMSACRSFPASPRVTSCTSIGMSSMVRCAEVGTWCAVYLTGSWWIAGRLLRHVLRWWRMIVSYPGSRRRRRTRPCVCHTGCSLGRRPGSTRECSNNLLHYRWDIVTRKWTSRFCPRVASISISSCGSLASWCRLATSTRGASSTLLLWHLCSDIILVSCRLFGWKRSQMVKPAHEYAIYQCMWCCN